AAFPILIVVVLAFFAQRLISPNGETKKPDFGQFLVQIDGGQVKSADIKTKDNTIDVTRSDGQKYEVGYPDGYAKTLVDTPRDKNVTFDVESKKSNGWLALLTYILPFIIFIGFCMLIFNHAQRRGFELM